jgi:hypothetical protein
MRQSPLILFLSLIHFQSVRTFATTTITSSRIASVRQILVFASQSDVAISFNPKLGWLLKEEKDLQIFLSGSNLQNGSIAFSNTLGRCESKYLISSNYILSAESIIELNVRLRNDSKQIHSVYLCFWTINRNATQLSGPLFTFVRQKDTFPFALKLVLILMLFIISGFFRSIDCQW